MQKRQRQRGAFLGTSNIPNSFYSFVRKRKTPLFLILGSLLLLGALLLQQTTGFLFSQKLLPPYQRLPAVTSPIQSVDPFIGTTAPPANAHLDSGYSSGNVFPGAAYPHGMVQWSPDTTSAPGGYRYTQTTIRGFSLTHFSGRGCQAYQDFPFLPTTSPLKTGPFRFSDYATAFSHNNEEASPGYYSVLLFANKIQVSLTVTPHTGMGAFHYPPTPHALLLINAGGSATGNSAKGTGIRISNSNTVTGMATSGHFCGKANTYTVYFAAQFAQPFTSFGAWNGAKLTPGSRTSTGSASGAYLQFDTTRNQTIQVKVGLSFVSTANALLNLRVENPAWNFQAIRATTAAAWSTHLNQILVSGGTPQERTIFYTALYHTLFHPNIFSDVNGQYPGFDGHVHTAHGYIQYENFPGWDMYRSLTALLALLEPHLVGDMLQSLLADAQQGGGGLPRWEVANDNSGGMVGDSMDAVIATSYALGVRNFNAQAALLAMDRGASGISTHAGKYVTREGLQDYLKLGYVSTHTPGSASITLEYALDDFALAQFAQALGNKHLAQRYLQRSHNWTHLFNSSTGYIEPRNPNGSFVPRFNPTSENGFVEGNSAQYSWMVPYDLPALFTLMGGDTLATNRLNYHFTRLNSGPGSPFAFMGNEPEFAAPWAYVFANQPYRTQDVVRRIETQLFKASPTGLPGNDDGGAMSSWYVFAALGLYPAIPGVGGFVVGSPLFTSATLFLPGGQQILLRAPGASDSYPYVQSLLLNDRLYPGAWLPFNSLRHGATLDFVLGSQPNIAWGTHR